MKKFNILILSLCVLILVIIPRMIYAEWEPSGPIFTNVQYDPTTKNLTLDVNPNDFTPWGDAPDKQIEFIVYTNDADNNYNFLAYGLTTYSCLIAGHCETTLNQQLQVDGQIQIDVGDGDGGNSGYSQIMDFSSILLQPTHTPTPTATSTPTQPPTPTPVQLIAVSQPRIWVGLKNSDDVGVKFDLRAELYKENELVTSGELNSVAAGSSGFNSAKQNLIPLDPFSQTVVPPGTQLSFKLLVRNACGGSGHNSGVARLWFNDNQADSQFGTTIGSTESTYYLLSNFLLGPAVGSGPKQSIDVQAGAKCSAFKPFGTWVTTL